MRVCAASLIWLGLAWLSITGASAQEAAAPTEYQIKAAFLFNFAKFVEWPPDAFPAPNSPLVIGVLGDNPFGEDLERTVKGKAINTHSFLVKPIHSAAEGTNCEIVFICSSEKQRLPQIISCLKSNSVLTVGEMDGFTASGGIINFVIRANKVRFEINDDAAKNARLKISSKLTSLAVRPAPG